VEPYPNAFIPNLPAPERAYGERTAPDTSWTGIQPQGPNNPLGQISGVPAMTITAAMAEKLEGPQPG
jgi:hypothetical protein